jgi:hypothetical protein
MKLTEKTILMICLISILAVMGNCANAYKKVTVVRDQIRFSFEYPSSFKDPYNTLNDSRDPMEAIVLTRSKEIDDNPDNNVFKIEIYKEHVALNIDKFVDDFLGAWTQLPIEQQFNLMEKTSLNIHGLSGVQLVYSVIYKGAGDTLNPYISYVQEVYFKHNELYWNIRLISVPELAEQSKNEFVRIIDSFNFLE